MRRLSLIVSLLAGAALLATGPGGAEMRIRLKSGKVLSLPVEAGEIESITFGEGKGGGPGRRPDAKRAGKPAPARAPARPSATTGARPTSGVLRVGPARRYKLPSEAAKVAKDGAVIEIDVGDYVDSAVWRRNRLTLRGVGGRPRITAPAVIPNRKAIWVIKGDDVRIENVELTGARVPDRNGAGIRHEGGRLTVSGSYIHHNENGILTSGNPKAELVVERSEIAFNTTEDQSGGNVHNIYVGRIRAFTLRYSYVHHATEGHNVKSRARTNRILYNRIMDEADGASSYVVEIVHGGTAYIIGNLLQQGPQAENWTMLSYGSGGLRYPERALYVVNNTFVNERGSGIFIRTSAKAPAQVINNIFFGRAKTLVQGPASLRGNLAVIRPGAKAAELKKMAKAWLRSVMGRGENRKAESPGARVVGDIGFANRAAYDYRLTGRSPAIDAGVDPGRAGDVSLAPVSEYAHPADGAARPSVGPLDVGAYEYAPR